MMSGSARSLIHTQEPTHTPKPTLDDQWSTEKIQAAPNVIIKAANTI